MVITASEVQGIVKVQGVTAMPFHPSHINRIGINKFDQEIFKSLPDIETRLQLVFEARCAWTLFYRGNPALVMGLEYRYPTNYEAWLLMGNTAYKHGLLLSRGAKRFFDNIGSRLNLRRMQIVVNVHNKTAVRWAEFLRFNREGLMSQYGPEGADYYMYARTY
jgi:hypothetical protein